TAGEAATKREEEKPQHEHEDGANPEDSDVPDPPLTIASENSRQPRVRGGEKRVTRAAHAAAITTTSARSMKRRPDIPVAPGVHLGGLPGDVEAIPRGGRVVAYRQPHPEHGRLRSVTGCDVALQ